MDGRMDGRVDKMDGMQIAMKVLEGICVFPRLNTFF